MLFNLKKGFEQLKNSAFLKDVFIWSMVVLGALLNMGFLYYIKSKINAPDETVNLNFLGIDYKVVGDTTTYNIPIFVALFSIFNIFIARLAYKYDLLMAYMLVITVPLFNAFYLASAVFFLNI